MQKGTTLYYHSHIKSNIQKVDQRTSHYIKHRKQFLKQYCQPLQQKINSLDEEISFYQHLIQNQNEMIENEEEVVQLKREIAEFTQTQKYFLEHLEDYQKKILQLTVQNGVIQQQIQHLKRSLEKITKEKAEQIYEQISTQRKEQILSKLHNSHNNQSRLIRNHLNNSKVSSNSHKTHSSNRSYTGHQQKLGTMLPAIFKVQKYYVGKETDKISGLAALEGGYKRMNRATSIANSQNKIKSFTVDVSVDHTDKSIGCVDSGKSIQDHVKVEENGSKAKSLALQLELKLKFKQINASFNRFESLFKECFQKKKSLTQKSVTQLQSKLISDREKFLQVCQAIGQKDPKKIEFRVFQTLTGDQIMTLLLSFPWIQRNLFKQLQSRRKLFVEIQTNKFI